MHASSAKNSRLLYSPLIEYKAFNKPTAYVLELPNPDPAGISDKDATSILEEIPVLLKHAFAISCFSSSTDSTHSDVLCNH